MTGLGWNSNKLYTSTTYGSYEGCYTFNFYTTYFSGKSTYIPGYWGSESGYDIAYHDGDIWMAVDNATSPIRCYEQTSGGVLSMIPADIGIGSDIYGVTYETGTDAPYLWVSNQTTDELYRIDIYTGIADNVELVLPDMQLSFSSNPFYSSVVITGSGFSSTSVLEIHATAGRMIERSNFGGTYTWFATGLPTGTYIVTVSDFEGSRESMKLLKL